MPYDALPAPIEGLVILEPKIFEDERGFFTELFKASDFEALGLPAAFPQDNLSFSRRGVLRGLHFQRPPHAQGKLVTVLAGEALDVAVDLRASSPTFGQWFSVLLNDWNRRLFYVPPGFAHGFAVLSETCLFHYKCTDVYDRETEGGLLWNDPTLNVDWQVDNPLVSEKDRQLPLFDPNPTHSPFP